MVEEERLRADQLEEQKSFAELQNELLTEMVAAEQVTTIALKSAEMRRVRLHTEFHNATLSHT